MKKTYLLLLCSVISYLLLSGCSQSKELPDEPLRPVVTVQKQQIEIISGESCWFGTKTVGICGDPPHPDIFYKTVKEAAVIADAGEVIRIKFPMQPDDFTLTVDNPDGKTESIGQANQYSYTIPEEPGYYTYTLSAVWDVRNTAAFYFGIQINE